MITAIVAIAANFAIGRDGKLPWHYPADLRFFKETTSGGTVVMGFNTWESIGKPLPKRLNIVLSRTREIEPRAGVVLLRSKSDVVSLAPFLKGDAFIIGGAQIYRDFADVIERWIVTEIPETVADADVFMPQNFLAGFSLSETIALDDGLNAKIYIR